MINTDLLIWFYLPCKIRPHLNLVELRILHWKMNFISYFKDLTQISSFFKVVVIACGFVLNIKHISCVTSPTTVFYWIFIEWVKQLIDTNFIISERLFRLLVRWMLQSIASKSYKITRHCPKSIFTIPECLVITHFPLTIFQFYWVIFI